MFNVRSPIQYYVFSIATSLAFIISSFSYSAQFKGYLLLHPNPDGRSMTLQSEYVFIDDEGIKWTAPAGEITDGASIPQWAWSFGLGPFEDKYRDAAVIHDWYCDHRVRPWQDVHLMFYHAMLASGVEPLKAQALYVAVLIGGPRWNIQTIQNERVAELMKRPKTERPYIIGPAPKELNASPEGGTAGRGNAEMTIVAIPSRAPDVSRDQRQHVLSIAAAKILSEDQLMALSSTVDESLK